MVDDYTAELGDYLSVESMAGLGLSHIAYIKPPGKGEKGWSVHSADGNQLAVFPNQPAAYYTARQYNLTPVNVH